MARDLAAVRDDDEAESAGPWAVGHEKLKQAATGNDFHIAPCREDGTTPGTSIWVWPVSLDDVVFVGTGSPQSRWFTAAITNAH